MDKNQDVINSFGSKNINENYQSNKFRKFIHKRKQNSLTKTVEHSDYQNGRTARAYKEIKFSNIASY